MNNLQSRIKELERLHGSLRAAARATEVDVGYLKRLRDGEKTNPSDAILAKLGLTRKQSSSNIDILILRIRSLIADKEMVTAQANHDLARFGEWRFDYSAQNDLINAEINALLEERL